MSLYKLHRPSFLVPGCVARAFQIFNRKFMVKEKKKKDVDQAPKVKRKYTKPPKGTITGRPREHDRDEIAAEMLEWAKNPTSINLNGFCCSRETPISPNKITLWASENETFRLAYECTKSFIAHRREQMLNENRMHVKAYDMNATTYDHFMKRERQIAAEHAASLQKDKQEQEVLTPQQILSIKTILDEN